MTKALILSLKEWWATQPERRAVERVVLSVGRFTCVEPSLLRTAFARQRAGTFLESADLVIREIPFVARCRACARDYAPDLGLHYACPGCGSALDEIVSGRELKIERVEWAS
jgi:hydrogenase nickel incorporation protein HypA/HybF